MQDNVLIFRRKMAFKHFQTEFKTSLSALKEFLMTRNQSMASEKIGAQRTSEIRFLSVP